MRALGTLLRALAHREAAYAMAGALLFAFAWLTARDRANPARAGTALFWATLGALFAFGGAMPAWAAGACVVALVALDGLGLVRRGAYGEAPPEDRARSAARLGARVALPVLVVPALTFAVTTLLRGRTALAPNALLYLALGYSSVLGGLLGLAITRARPAALFHEGRRLADAVGAAIVLPQLLASLGELFRAAGVGVVLASKVSRVMPAGSPLAASVVLCASMALFTFIMGNSFAAYPVIMAGVGVPLLIRPFHADPATVGALAMTAASCGTLCTPMAANFNTVPAALFEMRDRNGVIRFQAPLAAALFVAHVLLVWRAAAG